MNSWIDILALVFLSAGPEPSFERLWSRSVELESSGDIEGALSVLEAEEDRFRQDYSFTLRRAWLSYELERFDEAAALYRSAIELSGGALDARLGLAWSMLELGETEDAHAAFTSLLTESPKLPTVKQGLELSQAQRRSVWSARFVGTGHHYTSHPLKTNAVGATVGLFVRPWPKSQFGIVYRGSYFGMAGTGQGQGNGPGPGGDVDDFTQHELYLSGGYDSARFAVLAHFAHVIDNSDAPLSADIGGLSFRLRAWGELGLSATWSHYSDLDVLRARLAWLVPLGAGWSLEPAAAIQRTDTEWLGNAMLTLAFAYERGSFWLGGKYGDESRPMYLEQPSTFNLPERIQFGGRAGASVNLGQQWLLFSEYEIHRLSDEAVTPLTISFLHLLSVGVTRRF